MAYKISITTVADSHLQALPVREQRIVQKAVAARLQEFPSQPTRAIKQLRPNPYAEYELRVGNLRILYNVEEEHEVVILLIGRKVGNKLIVAGEEFNEHQQDSPKSVGDGPAGDSE